MKCFGKSITPFSMTKKILCLFLLFLISVVSFGQPKKDVVYSTGHYSYKGELIDNEGTKLIMKIHGIHGKEITINKTGTIYYGIDNEYDSKASVLYFLKEEKRMGLIIDYSDAILDDMDYDERIKLENDWNTASTKYENWMRHIISTQIEDMGVEIVKEDDDYSYVLLVKVIKVEDDGDNTLHCYIYPKNNISNPVVTYIVHGKGGGRGVFTDLMGKGLKDAAEIIGDNIKKNMVKTKPRKDILKDFKTHELYVDYVSNTFIRNNLDLDEEIEDNDDVIPMNGIGIGYKFHYKLSNKKPFVASVGVNINYSFGTDSYLDYFYSDASKKYSWEHEMKYAYCSFPLNIEYTIELGHFNIIPQIGTGLKLNLYSQETLRCREKEYEKIINRMEDDIMYDKGKRVQPFVNIGMDFSYRNLIFGGLFQYDLNDFCKNKIIVIDGSSQYVDYIPERFRTFQLKVGYRF